MEIIPPRGQRIESPSNETIKRYASLKAKKYRERYGMYLLEGLRIVKDALSWGVELAAFFVREDCENLISELGLPESKTYIAAERAFKQLCDTETPQGIVAVAKIPGNGAGYDDPPDDKGASAGILTSTKGLLLDGISDSGNLGALIRSAAGFGYKDIFLTGCADPYAPKTVRSTMSGIFKVNIKQCGYEIIDALKKNGVQIVCADMDGGDASAFRPFDKFVLCIGGEARGLSAEIRAAADRIVALKQQNIESLNAAVAGSILMYLYSV